MTRLRDLETLWKSNAKAAASRVSINFFLVTAFKFSACELDFIKKTKRWKWWISDEIKKIVYFPHAKRTLYLLLDNFSNFSLIHLTMKICHTRFFIDTALILSCLKNYLLTLWSILRYYLIQNINKYCTILLFQNNFMKAKMKICTWYIIFCNIFKTLLEPKFTENTCIRIKYPHPSQRWRGTVNQWFNLNLENITSFEFTPASFFCMIQFDKSSQELVVFYKIKNKKTNMEGSHQQFLSLWCFKV